MATGWNPDDLTPNDGAVVLPQNLDDLGALGLTCTVEVAAKVLGQSRAAAYRAAKRFRDTGGAEGVPVLLLGERRMIVSVPALRHLLATGVPPSVSGTGQQAQVRQALFGEVGEGTNG